MGLAAISYKEQLGGFKRPEQRATGMYYLAHVTWGKVFRIIPEFRSTVAHWQSVRLWIKGWVTILTSTKNASLIITDFLAMIYKNEQPHTASLCRGWAML